MKTQYYINTFIFECALIYTINSLSTLENENENLARIFNIDIFQQGNLEVADEILSHNFVINNPILPPEIKHGPEGLKKFASTTMTALSYKQYVHEDTIVKEDKDMIR